MVSCSRNLMKLLRPAFAAFAALLFTALVFAADASPAGAWKWTINAPTGDSIDVSVKLELSDDGKLTGTYESPFGTAKISQASFSEGKVAFAVEREFDGNKFVVKYAGKLE